MAKNQFETLFNKNISRIIRTQIDELNKHSVILKEVLPNLKLKLTDNILLDEINFLFDEDCITDRTYRYIKDGVTSSSAFNIFIIIYTLNDITSQVNETYAKYGKVHIEVPLIKLDDLLEPLKG